MDLPGEKEEGRFYGRALETLRVPGFLAGAWKPPVTVLVPSLLRLVR